MNTIEEQLWNYIDGNCTPAEKLEIEAKLGVNLQYNKIYQELLNVQNELSNLDFEEPSMSFSRNVMERVNTELKPVALKTKVDNRIIYSFGAVFLLALAVILGYALATSNLKLDFNQSKVAIPFKEEQFINQTSLTAFLFVDMILALIYLDSFLRKRITRKTTSA